MKSSKFIKDLFATGLTQVVHLLLMLILLRVMATVLSKEYFGAYMVIRRIIGIGAPLIALNLGLGLARYISYRKDKARDYLRSAFSIVLCIGIAAVVIFSAFRSDLSYLFFGNYDYQELLALVGLILLGNAFFDLSYSFYRGSQDMGRANVIQIVYNAIPFLIIVAIWVLLPSHNDHDILFYFLLLYALSGAALGLVSLGRQLYFNVFSIVRKSFADVKDMITFSIVRIPSGFMLSLIFGTPVFIASRCLTLVEAGYIGIGISLLRLVELVATPFNLLFLPKFAEIKTRNNREEIAQKASVVLDFIFSVLPVVVAVALSLSRYAVLILFGEKYVEAVPSVFIIIAFSAFYIAYVLMRGILDGLYSYPYVNNICLASFAVMASVLLVFHDNIIALSVGFGIGMSCMGIFSLFVLVRNLKMRVPLKNILVPVLIAVAMYAISFYYTTVMESLVGTIWLQCAALVVLNMIFLMLMYGGYWKPRSLWFRELYRRVQF